MFRERVEQPLYCTTAPSADRRDQCVPDFAASFRQCDFSRPYAVSALVRVHGAGLPELVHRGQVIAASDSVGSSVKGIDSYERQQLRAGLSPSASSPPIGARMIGRQVIRIVSAASASSWFLAASVRDVQTGVPKAVHQGGSI